MPDTSLARFVTAAVTGALSRPLAAHRIRSYLFARVLADHLGAMPGQDYDEQLLFAACLLHDMGLSEAGDGDQRFEVDGADLAASLLTDQGLPGAQVDAVWEAIALHTSPGIAERRGLLCRLTRAGVGMDFGRATEAVSNELGAAIHALHPRLALETVLVQAITEQALRTPSKAPRYSTADAFLLERTMPPHVTRMEQGVASSRWGS